MINSVRQQVSALRQLATGALDAYPMVDPQLRFIAHGENTTFRVDTSTDRFLIRVHRPARHGREVDPVAAIRSELRWLTALRLDTDLSVPAPVLTRDGELTTVATSAGVPGARVCSVLRWMDGRIHSESPRPIYLNRLGAAMAQLHNHADGWCPPAGFVRIGWTWETFFGDTMEYGGLPARAVWDLLPLELRHRFDRVAVRMERVMADLGDKPGAYGLIHADLHLGNALFLRDDVRLIDFDDCGHGHRLYDVAVALWELRHRLDYESFRAALIAGYTRHRPLAADDLDHLDDFIATREVAYGLWFVGTAQVNPALAADLDRVVRDTSRSLDVLSRH